MRGGSFSPRPSAASPTARRLPRTAPPVTGRLRSPPYPAAAPASTTTRPSASRQICRSPGECHSGRYRNAAHCPYWPLQPQRCSASRCAGRACGAPLTLETSASPAGLTARARPEARPDRRAANLDQNRPGMAHLRRCEGWLLSGVELMSLRAIILRHGCRASRSGVPDGCCTPRLARADVPGPRAKFLSCAGGEHRCPISGISA